MKSRGNGEHASQQPRALITYVKSNVSHFVFMGSWTARLYPDPALCTQKKIIKVTCKLFETWKIHRKGLCQQGDLEYIAILQHIQSLDRQWENRDVHHLSWGAILCAQPPGCLLVFTCCEEGPYKTLEVLLSNENGRYQPTSGQFAYHNTCPSRSQSSPLIIQASFCIRFQTLNLTTQTILKQSLMTLYRGLSFQCLCWSSWHSPSQV